MNIEYEVTVEDDLNARYTNWVLWLKFGKLLFIPSRYFPVFLCTMSIGFIIWGLLTQVPEDRYALLSVGSFCFLVSILVFFLYKPQNALSSFNRKEIEKEHKNYLPHQEQRNIILTAEELIFKTANSETAWSWQALKSYREEEHGFEFYFFSGHKRFVPKRVFADEQQLNDFKHLIDRYKTTAKKDEQ